MPHFDELFRKLERDYPCYLGDAAVPPQMSYVVAASCNCKRVRGGTHDHACAHVWEHGQAQQLSYHVRDQASPRHDHQLRFYCMYLLQAYMSPMKCT